MIEFPLNPTVGQEYTQDGKSWKWNSFAWDLVPVTSVQVAAAQAAAATAVSKASDATTAATTATTKAAEAVTSANTALTQANRAQSYADQMATGQVNADWTATSGKALIMNKPTIPTNTNQLTNGAGFITAAQVPAQGVTSVNTRTGAVTLTRADVGLGNVENKSSATILGEITVTNIAAALGKTPMLIGAGTNQTGNNVKIGWLTGSRLGLEVDVTDFGSTWPININGTASALNGQGAAYYLNAANFTGTLADARLPTTMTAKTFSGTVTGFGFVSTDSNALRMKPTGNLPAVLLRNDGSNFYFLLTDAATPDGTFNALRPMRFGLTSGDVFFGHNVGVTGQLTAGGIETQGLNATTIGLLSGGAAFFRDTNGTVEGRLLSSGGAFFIQAGSSGSDATGVVNINRYATADASIAAMNVFSPKLTLRDAAASDTEFNIDGNGAYNRAINFKTDNVMRWQVAAADDGASNFKIRGADTAGALREFVTIDRASGHFIAHFNHSVYGVFAASGDVRSNANVHAHYGADGQVTIGNGGSGIEIGKTGRTTAGGAYIDFHSSANSPDYDARIIASGGSTAVGQGLLTFEASVVKASGQLHIASTQPVLVLNETDQAGAVGAHRIVADGGGVRFDKNMAAARDFATYTTPWSISASGIMNILTPTFSSTATITGGTGESRLVFSTTANPNVFLFNRNNDGAFGLYDMLAGVTAFTYTPSSKIFQFSPTTQVKGHLIGDRYFATDLDSLAGNRFFGFSAGVSAATGAPASAGAADAVGLQMDQLGQRTQLVCLADAQGLLIRTDDTTDGTNGWGQWKQMWDSGNLTKLSQLTNDLLIQGNRLRFWDLGNSGTTATYIDANASNYYRLQISGASPVTLQNFNLVDSSMVVIELVHGASFPFTWATSINWIKADGSGTSTTNFNEAGYTLKAVGTDWVLLWGRNGVVWGKVMR